MLVLEHTVRTKVLCGINAKKKIVPEMVKISTTKHPVIVTDATLVQLELIEPIIVQLKQHGFQPIVYDQVKSNPTVKNIDDVAQILRDLNSDCVIGIGGGSPLDVAKAASLVASAPLSVKEYALQRRPFPEKKVKCVTLPTTAGTGAEVTNTVIFSTEEGRKLWGWAEGMAPEVAILDPQLTVGLPPGLTAATGLDAIVHAIEACTGQRQTPLIEAYSFYALNLLSCNLVKALYQPDNLEVRKNLMIGALFAGLAIEYGGTGLAHCIGHGLSTVGGLHHGQAVAVALYHIYPWNVEKSPEKINIFAQVAKALGVAGDTLSSHELAIQGAEAYQALVEGMPINLDLSKEGLSSQAEESLLLAIEAPENEPMKKNNCSIPTEAECRVLARKILSPQSI